MFIEYFSSLVSLDPGTRSNPPDPGALSSRACSAGIKERKELLSMVHKCPFSSERYFGCPYQRSYQCCYVLGWGKASGLGTDWWKAGPGSSMRATCGSFQVVRCGAWSEDGWDGAKEQRERAWRMFGIAARGKGESMAKVTAPAWFVSQSFLTSQLSQTFLMSDFLKKDK